MIFEANLKLESARRLLEKARKDNKAVSVTRSGSFASVDGRSKFLSQGKGDNSSQKGFSGARSQATRKSAFQKSSRQPIPSEDVPLEYLSCMAGMAETIQSLLKLIEEQDDTIGRLREQTGNTQNLPTETSISSIVSESNLDWGQRKRFQTIDDDEKTNLRGLTMSVPAYGNNLKPTRLTAPARSTSGDIRPRSFHEDLSDDNKVT